VCTGTFVPSWCLNKGDAAIWGHGNPSVLMLCFYDTQSLTLTSTSFCFAFFSFFFPFRPLYLSFSIDCGLSEFLPPSSLTPTHSLCVHFSYLSSKCAVGPSKNLQFLFLKSQYGSQCLSLANKPRKCAIKFMHGTIFLCLQESLEW